jgi:glycosyl transferase family 25
MEEQLAKVGLSAEFIAAVEGRNLSPEDLSAYDVRRALQIYGVEMMDAEIGCYLSHYRLYERMVRENITVAVILEDDLDIEPILPSVIHDLTQEENPAWLIVRLESLRGKVIHSKCPKSRGRQVKALSQAALYRLDTHILGSGGYIIRKEGAQRMLDYGRRIFMPIDQTMDRFWENGIIPYIVKPFPLRQRQDFESRIGSRPPRRHYSQPVKVRLWRRWQRLSDGLRKRLCVLRYK